MFTVHINITCYYAGWRREPASKIWSNFIFIVVTNWQVFFKPSCIPSLPWKVVWFIGCNFKSHASQVGLNTNRQNIFLNFSNGNIFSVRNSGINLFEITSMICVFSSNLSLRSCSVVLYTCSASANSAARSFSFSWTWRCSFKTVSLCCSSISWICCNSEAFSCSN